MTDARRRLGSAALVGVLALLAAAGVAEGWLRVHHSLFAEQVWEATEIRAARHVAASVAYNKERKPVAHGHLDLSAFFTYTEVWSNSAYPVGAVSMRVHLSPGSWFGFLADVHPGDDPDAPALWGTRLGTEPELAAASLVADTEGRLHASAPAAAPLPGPGWHVVDVEYADTEARVSLDGAPWASVPLPARAARRLGLRGGHEPVLVDDVVVRDPSGAVLLRESFRPRAGRLLVTWTVFGAVLVLDLLLLLVVGRPFPLAALNLGVAVAAGLFLVVDATTLSEWYALSADAEPYQIGHTLAEDVTERVDSELALPSPGDRVLLMGTSQVWGSGVEHREHIVGERLERRLTQRLGRPVEVVNAAVQGAVARTQVASWAEQWTDKDIDVVVAVLGNNDPGPDGYEDELERLVRVAAEHRTAVILVNEPTTWEWNPELNAEKHAAARRVAERHGLPLVEAHEALRDARPRGFLWRDYVHLTCFGHAVLAEVLEAPVAEALSE